MRRTASALDDAYHCWGPCGDKVVLDTRICRHRFGRNVRYQRNEGFRNVRGLVLSGDSGTGQFDFDEPLKFIEISKYRNVNVRNYYCGKLLTSDNHRVFNIEIVYLLVVYL